MDKKSEIEKFGTKFNRNLLLESQKRAWEALNLIQERATPGMTEEALKNEAHQIFESMGIEKHWHKVLIRFGENTVLSFKENSKPDVTLKEGEIYFIDIGPVWKDHEGDVGKTFVCGKNARIEKLASDSEVLFQLMKEAWKNSHLTGFDLYSVGVEAAKKMGWVLQRKVDGHRLSDFPHALYFKGGLDELDFSPSPYAWILEVQLHDPQTNRSAFYEDLLL